jgi:hypothetical protein
MTGRYRFTFFLLLNKDLSGIVELNAKKGQKLNDYINLNTCSAISTDKYQNFTSYTSTDPLIGESVTMCDE